MANVFGWIFKSPIKGTDLIFGIISFFGLISVFCGISTLKLTIYRLKVFLKVLDFYIIYSFFVTLNQIFSIIETQSPLLYGGFLQIKNAYGTFGDSELFGEYFLILFMFYFPMLLSDLTKIALNIKYTRLIIIVLLTFVQALMSVSRSVFLLLIFGVFLFAIYNIIFNNKVLNKTSNLGPLIIASTLFLMILSTFVLKDIGMVLDRMEDKFF